MKKIEHQNLTKNVRKIIPDCRWWVNSLFGIKLCAHVDAGVEIVVDVYNSGRDVLQQEVGLDNGKFKMNYSETLSYFHMILFICP